VVRTLAWQRRACGLACEAVDQDRPGYLREALGPVPESTRRKRAWRQAAAQAEYRCRRTVEHAAWARTLPLRVAATALAGLGGLLLAAVAGLPPPASLLSAMVLVGAAWWRLRFRLSPETEAWRRGAEGERQVARLLEPLVQQGWGVQHDLRVPGSKANIDHVVIGPPGVFVIDAKNYRGRLRRSRDGCCGTGGPSWRRR
jgi:hypothetical protein